MYIECLRTSTCYTQPSQPYLTHIHVTYYTRVLYIQYCNDSAILHVLYTHTTITSLHYESSNGLSQWYDC